jgi:hypothetical protein
MSAVHLPDRRRKPMFMALYIGILLALIECARLGVSGLIVEVAQVESDRWENRTRARTMADLNRVANYFSDGLGYVPTNPWALEGLGVIDLARVRVSKAPTEALDFAVQAHSRFRAALKERPTSPFLWANLAMSKLYLDQIDTEFSLALRHADELGPWEPGSQQVVLFAGLATWEKLDVAQRRAIERVVERGALRNSSRMFEIVRMYRRLDLVCTLSGYDAVASAECKKTAAPLTPVKLPGREKRQGQPR